MIITVINKLNAISCNLAIFKTQYQLCPS